MESSGKDTLQGKVNKDGSEESPARSTIGGADGGWLWYKLMSEHLWVNTQALIETADVEAEGLGSGLDRFFFRAGWEGSGLSCRCEE